MASAALPVVSTRKSQFRKSVLVVNSRAHGPVTLVQRKIMNSWLRHAIRNPPDSAGWWTISVAETSEDIGFDSKDIQLLKDAADDIGNLKFDFDALCEEEKNFIYKKSSLFPDIEIVMNGGALHFRFKISSEVQEKILDPQIFSIIDMHIVRKFKRAYALAIWEFCIRSTKFGATKEISWTQFRDMILGVSSSSKSYQQYKFFKSRILKECIEEINSVSNHFVELKEIKKGRTVEKIVFAVKNQVETEDDLDSSLSNEATILLGMMINLGIAQAEAKKICAGHSIEKIRAAIDYTNIRIKKDRLPKLESSAAYFRDALSQGYAEPVEAEVNSTPARNQPQKTEESGPDLTALFARYRRKNAKDIFNEVNQEDRDNWISRYNDQQNSKTLKYGKKINKAVEIAFFDWMAQEMWGTASANEILAFCSEFLAGKHKDLLG